MLGFMPMNWSLYLTPEGAEQTRAWWIVPVETGDSRRGHSGRNASNCTVHGSQFWSMYAGLKQLLVFLNKVLILTVVLRYFDSKLK
jgi:hypothetical protein